MRIIMRWKVSDMNLVGRHHARTGASGFVNVTLEKASGLNFNMRKELQVKYQITCSEPSRSTRLVSGRKHGCRKFFFYKLRNYNFEWSVSWSIGCRSSFTCLHRVWSSSRYDSERLVHFGHFCLIFATNKILVSDTAGLTVKMLG